jgi:phosphoglycerate dehydrogenase-like enzyme
MNLLLAGTFNYTQDILDHIKRLGFNVHFVNEERVPVEKQNINFNVCDINAVVCNSLFLYNDIKIFKNLEFIQLTSAGYDRVPIDYINNQGICLFNAKNVYSIPISEWCILKILEIYKSSTFFYNNQKMKKWEKRKDLLELTSKTITIVGCGSVGKEIAKRIKVFGTTVLGVDKINENMDFFDKMYPVSKINDALIQSDVVILSLPLNIETKNLFNREKFKILKNKSVLINLSRGGVIDETDLIEALKEDRFLGVALDVFKEEPLSENSALWDFSNILISPHNSFVSDKVKDRLANVILANLTNFAKSTPSVYE